MAMSATSLRSRPSGDLRSRTRGSLRLYRALAVAFHFVRLFLQAARNHPLSAALGLSRRWLATAGNEALGRWGLPSPRPHFPLRSACLADGALPRVTKRFAGGSLSPLLSAALGLSCRRLATVGNEAIGRWGLLPPYLHSLLRSAYTADCVLPQATKRLVSCARNHGSRVKFLASVHAKLRPQASVLALRAAGANKLLKPASTTPRSYGRRHRLTSSMLQHVSLGAIQLLKPASTPPRSYGRRHRSWHYEPQAQTNC
jgi:hypothetical protein